jgi:Concanavalin A-like lectin/glucanases superfamily
MYKFIWLTLITFFLISCETKTPVDPDINGSKGQLSFSIDMTQAPDDVVALQGILSRADHDTVFFDFEMRDNEAIAEVEGLISGTWLLRVNALDEDGHIIYSGSTDVTVVSGQTTTVYLNLEPTTGNLKIIVTWGGRLNPVAYYPFNGNARDESGNGNDGEVFGAVLTEDHLGKADKAYQFDGVDDYIDIGNNPMLKPQFPIVVAAWIYVESFDHHNPIFTNNFDDGEYFGMWMMATSSKTISLAYGNGGPAGPGSRRAVGTVNEVLRVKEWFHVVGIIEGPEKFEIYVNGEKVETAPGGSNDSTSVVYNGNPASIGRTDGTRPEGNTNHFHGKIDELYIFDHSLSTSTIEALYNSGL